MTNYRDFTTQSDQNRSNMSRNKFKKQSRSAKFRANVRGFGKKGNFGRGTHIEADEYTYFVNIFDAIKANIESADEKVSMANNVFEQTIDKEIHLSSNQLVSSVVENLIGFTDPENFERFQNAFADNFRPICSDKFASHVLQKMIEISFLRAAYYKKVISDETQSTDEPAAKRKKNDPLSDENYNTTTKFSQEHRAKCGEFLLKIGKFLLNNLEDFVWDPFASHIMRSSVFSLVGIYESKVSFEASRQNAKHGKPVEVPDEWTDVVKEYANRLEMWPQFSDLPYNTLSSSLLGHILIGLRAVDKNMLKHLGKKLLTESFFKADDDDDKKKAVIVVDGDEKRIDRSEAENQEILPKVFATEASRRLLETMLATAGPKLFTQLNVMLFTGRIRTLALDRKSNFAVQKLIEFVKEKAEFETIFDELQWHFEELVQAGHTGVLAALANTCLRLATKQAAFASALQTALHTVGSKEQFRSTVKCILKLKPFEAAVDDKSSFIHVHGSLILQHMLQFNKPIKLVQSMLDMPANTLVEIFTSSNGSYVADTFIASKTIGEKSREKLLRHLEGSYLDLAVAKFGSRVLENLFAIANDGQKAHIVKELSRNVNQLNGTLFGRVLYKKLRVETYRLSPVAWKAGLNKGNKADKLFGDILK